MVPPSSTRPSSPVHVSGRVPHEAQPNALTHALRELDAAGQTYIDLTVSNPTQVGLVYPMDLLPPLGSSGGARYDPQPFGVAMGREAVALDYERRSVRVDPADVILTTSSSEAYSWLFKLLCDPGDRVLVPRPSYPLFEHLSRLEGVEIDGYDLEYHGRWRVNLASVAHARSPRTRAVLVVTPNNPTGSYLCREDATGLRAICAEHGLALIADEVFVDYPLEPESDRVTDLAVGSDVPAFTLGGLSKSVGLPGLKLGWMVVGGPESDRRRAKDALELIADTYLSVSTPVQHAAHHLLAVGGGVRDQILARISANLTRLRALVTPYPACDVLPVEGGWYAVIRVPAHRPEEQLMLDLLRDEHVLVHPGYFFDFPGEAYLIVSLLADPVAFEDGARRVLRRATL